SPMFHCYLCSVVIRIGDISGEAVVLAEDDGLVLLAVIVAEVVSCSVDYRAVRQEIVRVLAIAIAGRRGSHLVEPQTKRRVTGIGIVLRNQTVALGSYISQGQHGGLGQLALDGKIIVFRIGKPVVNVVSG